MGEKWAAACAAVGVVTARVMIESEEGILGREQSVVPEALSWVILLGARDFLPLRLPGRALCALPPAAGLALMESGSDFGGISLVVQLAEPIDDLGADGEADGVAGALGSLVEPVVQAARCFQEVLPAIGTGRGLVDRTVHRAEFDDVIIVAAEVVNQVVCGSEPEVAVGHETAPVILEGEAVIAKFLREIRTYEGLEDVSGGVADPSLEA